MLLWCLLRSAHCGYLFVCTDADLVWICFVCCLMLLLWGLIFVQDLCEVLGVGILWSFRFCFCFVGYVGFLSCVVFVGSRRVVALIVCFVWMILLPFCGLCCVCLLLACFLLVCLPDFGMIKLGSFVICCLCVGYLYFVI